MADASLNRRQTIRVGAGVAFAQAGIVGFDGQIELEALRLFGLPGALCAVLNGASLLRQPDPPARIASHQANHIPPTLSLFEQVFRWTADITGMRR